jgi:kinesin family member 1
MTNKQTRNVWLWSKAKFINRKYLMQEMYQKWANGETVDTDQSKDPFWDPPEEVFLGSAFIYLQSLSYQIEADETLSITNYQGSSHHEWTIQI